MLISKKMIDIAIGDIDKIFIVAFLQFALNIIMLGLSVLIASVIKANNNFFQLSIQIIMLILGYFYISRKKVKVESNLDFKIKERLRKDAVINFFNAGLENFDSERTGNLTTTLVLRVDSISRYCSLYMPIIIATIATNLFVTYILYFFNKNLSIIFLLGFIGVIIVPQIWYKKIWVKNDAILEKMSTYKSEFLDNIQGMHTLKSLEARKRVEENMIFQNKEILRVNMESLTVTGLETLFIYLFLGLMIGVSIGYAGLLMNRGHLNVNEFIMLLFSITSCSRPVLQLVNAWHIGNSGIASLEKYEELMKLERREYIVKEPSKNFKGLLCESLKYSYGKEQKNPTLKNIDFEVEKGKKVAFVGKSGSGKSTLASIIAGLYPYQEGSISFDGLLLKSDNLKVWKSQVASVWQDQYIFNGSIKENMLLAKKDAGDNEIYRALKMVGLEELANKTQKSLDTPLGEMGKKLSGGERQRLAIARSILKDPKLLILDEVSSNLDEMNQNYIKEIIEDLPEDKTCIIIAHRLNTVINCDEIFVFEDGKIIDRGSYMELLEKSEVFKKLHLLQIKRDIK